MILQLKSKVVVIVDNLTMFQDFAYLNVQNVRFDGNQYYTNINYTYLVQNQSSGFTPVEIYRKDKSPIVFTVQEADALEQNIGTLQGTNHSERFKSLIYAGCMYKLSVAVDKPFGLNPIDWEIQP